MSLSTENLYDTKGIQVHPDAFIVIVRTEWNNGIVNRLEEGCKVVLEELKVPYKIILVPGALEIPFAIKDHADRSGEIPGAYIALGCVIRGDTPHFDYVCRGVTDGVVKLNLQLKAPVIFGVLTVENHLQAEERVGGIHGHKGKEAAVTALKMMAISASYDK